jgi:hypothetical protein
MTEDNRFLPFFLREPIYVVAEPEKVSVENAPLRLPVAGLGRKDVLVLVYEPGHAFLAPADQTLLEKILQAVRLSTDDIALVNWHPAQADLQAGKALDQYLPPRQYQTTIVFGEVPALWSQSNFFETYKVKINGTQRFLQANSLATLTEDSAQKICFWKCLQQLFLQP